MTAGLEPALVPMTTEEEQRAVEALAELLAHLLINEPAPDGKADKKPPFSFHQA